MLTAELRTGQPVVECSPKVLEAVCETVWALRAPMGEGGGATQEWIDRACGHLLLFARVLAADQGLEPPIGAWLAANGPAIAAVLPGSSLTGVAGYAGAQAQDAARRRADSRMRWAAGAAALPDAFEKGRPSGRPAVRVMTGQGPGATVLGFLAERGDGAPVEEAYLSGTCGPVLEAACRGVVELVLGPLTRRRGIIARLSPTQELLLPLVLGDLSEPEIGAASGRSHHTVHDHVRCIYRALGVSSRHELRELWEGRREPGELPRPPERDGAG